MSGINWDIVNASAAMKSQDYEKLMPNSTVANAYFQGYIENAAERESLRVINERQAKEIEVLKGHAPNDGYPLRHMSEDAVNKHLKTTLAGLV